MIPSSSWTRVERSEEKQHHVKMWTVALCSKSNVAIPGRPWGSNPYAQPGTWFEDETVAKTAAEPMHGLRLIIKEDVLPLSNHPKFEALAEVSKRGLLAPETWHCNRPYINLKTTIDVPPLGTVMSRTETDAWKTR